jgi:predicted lipoprotein with Yx(FWY)xxD motif
MSVTPQTRRPRRLQWQALAVIGAALSVATACQSATNELNPKQEGLGVADRSSLGKVLVDDEGRTVYLFEKDEAHDSYCTGACASVWPPVTTKGLPMVSGGLDASDVTLVKRDDGLMQVAYAGHPLYYYQADTSHDDTYGQELDQFGAEWYALTPSGGKAEMKTGGRSGNGSSNGSGGGYG